MIFPTYGNNIGCWHSLFKKDFPNLPPARITPSPSKNGSKREILLLLSSDFFKSLEFSTDFNHRSSSLSFRCCTVYINLIFACCSSLVLSRVAHFTFLMMMLIDLVQHNFLKRDYQCNSPNHSGPVWYSIFQSRQNIYRLCSETHNKFFLQFRILFADWRYYFVAILSCLWFPKKLWSKIPPFNFIIITNISPSWCIVCWVLLWTDIMPLGFIWMIFDKFNCLPQLTWNFLIHSQCIPV